MIKTKDEILNAVKTLLGEADSTDEALALFEDIADTLDGQGDGEDWKTKYEENDNQWRQKYRDRFFSKDDEPKREEEPSTDDSSEEPQTFDELFEEEKEKK